jgi:hypothetical protein
MPEAEIKKRGGAIRYRTLILKGKKGKEGTKYVHVAVVPKPGPRGGRTVMGPEHTVGESLEIQEERFRYKLFGKLENYLSFQ